MTHINQINDIDYGKNEGLKVDKSKQLTNDKLSNNTENRDGSTNKEQSRDYDKAEFSVTDKPETGIIFEAIKAEYDHSIHRSDKLDNKVYILLTVCAFLFVMLSDIIKSISTFPFPESKLKFGMEITFAIALFIGIVAFIVLLILLMKLLRGVTMSRYRTGELLEKDIASYDPITAMTFLGSRLEDSTMENEKIIEKRFKVFNACTRLIVGVIVDLILLAVLCQFIK